MEFVPGGLVILICLILILTIIFIFVWRIFCSKGDRVQAEVDLESGKNTTTEIDQQQQEQEQQMQQYQQPHQKEQPALPHQQQLGPQKQPQQQQEQPQVPQQSPDQKKHEEQRHPPFGIISSSSKGIDQIVQPKRDQHSGPDKSIVLDVRTILGNYTPRMDQNLSDGQSVKADPTNAMQMEVIIVRLDHHQCDQKKLPND